MYKNDEEEGVGLQEEEEKITIFSCKSIVKKVRHFKHKQKVQNNLREYRIRLLTKVW